MNMMRKSMERVIAMVPSALKAVEEKVANETGHTNGSGKGPTRLDVSIDFEMIPMVAPGKRPPGETSRIDGTNQEGSDEQLLDGSILHLPSFRKVGMNKMIVRDEAAAANKLADGVSKTVATDSSASKSLRHRKKDSVLSNTAPEIIKNSPEVAGKSTYHCNDFFLLHLLYF